MKSPQAATEPSAFEEAKTIAHALDFEVALAHGCAASGLITTAHAAAIESARQKLDLDPDETMEAARHAGTLAIAIVDRLRAAADAELRGAGKSVHLGATSQDLADTRPPSERNFWSSGATREAAHLDNHDRAHSPAAGHADYVRLESSELDAWRRRRRHKTSP
jgi:hypothetical protein